MEISYSTILIQLVIYLYCLGALHYLVFKPILSVLRLRDGATVGKAASAEELRKEMLSMEDKIDGEVMSLRATLDEARQETTQRQRQAAEQRVLEAKSRLEKQLVEKRSVLLKESEVVRARIPQLSESVAAEVVKAVLHSKVVRL
jgi:F0F1-type ATP synthase membrane subunit b/b'